MKKPKSFKVWVHDTVADELRRYGNIIAYKRNVGIRRVRATLTLTTKPMSKK